MSGFHLQKLDKFHKIIKQVRCLKKYTLLHSTPLNKIVLGWAIYPRNSINIGFEHDLYSTSKIGKTYLSVNITFCSAMVFEAFLGIR